MAMDRLTMKVIFLLVFTQVLSFLQGIVGLDKIAALLLAFKESIQSK